MFKIIETELFAENKIDLVEFRTCYRLDCVPQKGAPAPLNGTLFGNRVSAEDQVKMRS